MSAKTTEAMAQIRTRREARLKEAERDAAQAQEQIAEIEELRRQDLPDHQLRSKGMSEQEIGALRERVSRASSENTYARRRLEEAQRRADGWRRALADGRARPRIRATTNLSIGDGFRQLQLGPGDEAAVADDIVATVVASGAAELVVRPPLSARAKRGSAKLRPELAAIDKRREDRRSALTAAEAELADTRAALREIADDNASPADVAKAEARVNAAERNVRLKAAALDVEMERTEPERVALEAALAEAIAFEEDEASEAAETELHAEAIRRRARTIAAYEELVAALDGERALDAPIAVYEPADLLGVVAALRSDTLSQTALAPAGQA